MPPAVALCVAAGCFVAAIATYRHRDGVLRFMTRMRGLEQALPGPRRRYQRGMQGRLDMLAPVVFFVVFGTVFLIRAVLGLASR
jgi:hypothetical protein